MKTTIILFILTLVSSIFLTIITVNSGYSFQGDSGQLFTILESLHSGNGFYNPFLPTLIDYIFNLHIPSLSVEELCNYNFETNSYNLADFNHLKFHYYLILAPMSLLLYIFEAPYVGSGIVIFSFISFLTISFLIIRNNFKLNLLFAIFIVFAVSLHPSWGLSIQGQPYVDRLFLPLCLLLLYFSNKENPSFSTILILSIITSSVVEKGIFYVGIYLILHSILYFKSNTKLQFQKFILGILLLVVYFIIVKYYLNNIYYSSQYISLEAFKNNFLDQKYTNGTLSFLTINLFFLLPSIFFDRKLFLIALTTLIPNLVYNLGGAEKTNFYTHYHTFYYPFITFAFIQNLPKFINYFNKFVINFKYLIRLFLIGYLTAICFFYYYLSFDNNNLVVFSKSPYNNSYFSSFNFRWATRTNFLLTQEKVYKYIPLGSKVSSIEASFPYLFKYQNISMYPLNYQTADYIILGYQKNEDKYFYSGYSGYRGQDHTNQVDACMNIKLEKSNFDINNPILLSPTFALLKKISY